MMLMIRLMWCLGTGALLADAARRMLPLKKGKLLKAISVVIFGSALSTPSWVGDENLLLLLPFFLGVFYICYDAPPLAKLVTGMTFYVLLMPLNMMLDTAGKWAYLLYSENMAGYVVKCLMCLFIWLLVRCLTKGRGTLTLSRRLWAVCGLLVLSPLITLLSFSLWNGFARGRVDAAQLRLAYTVLPFCMFSAAALLIALTELSRQRELEQASRLAEMRELYYTDLRDREIQVRTLRHDLRNHFSAVQMLLEQGDTAKAQGYIAELINSPAVYGAKRVCENELANVVLSCKLEEMERLGLAPEVSVTLPEKMAVADTDLCALLGNALDNAMEAARDAEDKTIIVRARVDCGMFMLRVENGFGKPPVAEHSNASFRTTKARPREHGFGIRGMREIAVRYGGTLETSVRGNRFELVACLPQEICR